MVKRGDNIKFICTYLYNNPGARYTDIRNALCVANGYDPQERRGQYTWYFRNPSNRRQIWGGNIGIVSDNRWSKRDGRYYLTERGLAWVSQA